MVADDETKQNCKGTTDESLLNNVDTIRECIEGTKPSKHDCSQKDIENMLKTGLLLVSAISGTGLGLVLGGAGGANEAITEGSDTFLNRLEKGDVINAMSGGTAGACYGLAHGLTNGVISGYKNQIVFLLGDPMQNAMKDRDVAAGKQIMDKCVCYMEKDIPNQKDQKSQQISQQTAKQIEQEVKDIKPGDECTKDDIVKVAKAALLTIKFMVGVPLGSAIGAVKGGFGGTEGALEMASHRACHGNIGNTATGTLAGFGHGAAVATFTGFYEGINRSLNLI